MLIIKLLLLVVRMSCLCFEYYMSLFLCWQKVLTFHSLIHTTRIYHYTAWHQQQQQQGQAGASGKGGQGQGQQQQPTQQHYYPYWPGYQHPHAAAYHAQQQQQQQLVAARGGQQQGTTTVLPVAHQGKGQGNINCAQAVIERKKVKGTKKEFAPPKNIQSNKSHRRMDSKSSKSLSVSSSVGSTVASLSKKRSREESFDEGRDDLNTKSLSLSDQDDDNVSTSGLSLGGFSLGSLGERHCRD